MQTVRRIYLYLVAAISLLAISWAAIGLVRLILSEGIGQGQIIGLASLLAVIIVGLPLYLFHWLMAQRLAATADDEIYSPVRQLYLYILLAFAAAPIIANVYRLLDNALITLVGGIHGSSYPYDLTIAEHLAAIAVWLVVWFYHQRLVRPLSNRQNPLVPDLNLAIRRVYLLGFSLAGLAMTTWGAIGLVQTLMQVSTGVMWRTPIANFCSQLLVGTILWAVHWIILQQDFARSDPTEERSVLRKIYLYLLIFVYSVIAVGSGSLLLKRLLELLLGAPPSGEPLLSQLSIPVPMLLVGGLFWAYHWSVLKHDAQQAPEAPRQAGVRRIYAYLVATLGLLVLLAGVIGLLILLVELTTDTAHVDNTYYREQVSNFVSMVIVGLPVWLIPWRSMQYLATLPTTDTHHNVNERRSTIRKIYLYFFVFLASLVIFGSVGWFVFRLLTAILGADLPTDFLTQTINALLISLTAVGVWGYHWWAIRRDGSQEEAVEVKRYADVTVAVIDNNSGELGQKLLQALQRDLPGVSLTPIGLTPQAVTAMEGQPFSPAVIESAQYLIGPWPAFTTSEIAPHLDNHPAPKFVIPVAEPNWIWTGLKTQSVEVHIQQAVKGVKQAIDGDDINFNQGPDIGMVVAIIVGVIVFLCVGGNLLGLAISLLGL